MSAYSLALIIPTLNAESTLVDMLRSHESLKVQETVIVDGGSTDRTLLLAQKHGVSVLQTISCRGLQLAQGANATSAEWLLFQHVDTLLDEAACHSVHHYILTPHNKSRAAYFQLRFNNRQWITRILEKYVALRNRVFSLPYGDQGLLIARTLYEKIGGYKSLPLMEDVDLIDRLGAKRLIRLNAYAYTSSQRYQQEGYLLRGIRNLLCISLYRCGLPPKHILKIYESQKTKKTQKTY